MKRGYLLIAVSLFAVAHSGDVAAGPAENAARKHTKAGTTAYNLGHYQEAVTEYEAAYREIPEPALLFNIAQSHRLAGNTDKAVSAYKAFLRNASETAPNRELAEKHIKDLEAAAIANQSPSSSMTAAPPPQPLHPRTEVAPAAPEGLNLAAQSPEQTAPAPLYKKWWFWTGAATVVAAGVLTAFLLKGGQEDAIRGNAEPGVVVIR